MAEREWIQGQVCFVERGELTSKLIPEVEAYWNGLRGARHMPKREEIDPVSLARHLPYISTVELHYDPFRVRYRLIGTELTRMFDEDFTNRWLDETGWSEEAITLNRLIYEKVAEARAPLYGLSLLDWQGRPDHVFEWALFPLSKDDCRVDHCLSIDDFSVIARRSRLL